MNTFIKVKIEFTPWFGFGDLPTYEESVAYLRPELIKSLRLIEPGRVLVQYEGGQKFLVLEDIDDLLARI